MDTKEKKKLVSELLYLVTEIAVDQIERDGEESKKSAIEIVQEALNEVKRMSREGK